MTARRDDDQQLAALLSPRHTAVVVIDYQNDFVAEGGALHRAGLHSPQLGAIAPAINNLVWRSRRSGALVVFVRCHYDRDTYLSPAFLRQAERSFHGLYVDVPVCVSGTWGADFVDGVRPQDGDVVVTKHRFGAFEGTDLDLVLRTRGVRTLVVCGVVTHVCVESTVREAFFKDYDCVVPRETTAGWQPQWHQTSLDVMDWGFAQVVPVEAVHRVWNADSQGAGGAPTRVRPA
ncbi:cysteine hydrolase family protein [Micromonospora sp. NPDC005113]